MEKYAFCKSFVCACVFAALPCLNALVWRLHYLHTSLFLCALAGTSFPKCVFLLAKRHIIVLKRHVSTFLEAFFHSKTHNSAKTEALAMKLVSFERIFSHQSPCEKWEDCVKTPASYWLLFWVGQITNIAKKVSFHMCTLCSFLV